ncbi:hypothetical protein M5689_003632 [Euphorbia peplus]|nr:hypothetical protein M5689_003632 [Euphorbia peplus]
MEKKGSSSPHNVCKKLCRSFRRNRRVSHPSNLPVAATKIPNSNNMQEKAADSVPVRFDYTSQAAPSHPIIKKNTHLAKVGDAKSHEFEKGDQKSGVHIEDRFSEFITSARIKIGTSYTNCEPGGKISSVKDNKTSEFCSMKDRFSDYIDRTKKKLRTPSTVGVDNSISFK